MNTPEDIEQKNSKELAKASSLSEIFSIADMVIAIFLFGVCMFIFNKMYPVQEDQAMHLDFIFKKVDTHLLFIKFSHCSIMQWLVYILGFGNKSLMFQAFPFLLSLAFLAKYFVIRFINADFIVLHDLKNYNKWFLRALALMISLAFPIYTYLQLSSVNWYRSLTPHCVWHNPTIIVAMPFALLLFWESFKLLLNNSLKNFLLFFALLLLNFFSKPVFLMACLPIFMVFFFFFKFNDDGSISFSLTKKKIILASVIAIPSLIIIIYLYKMIFGAYGLDISFVHTLANHNKNYNFISSVLFVMRKFFCLSISNGCIVAIFTIFALISRILLLNAFYFLSTFVVKKEILTQNLYAFSIWLFGLIITLLVTEIRQPRSENFLWHLIACNLVLLVVGANNLIYYYGKKKEKDNVFSFLSFSALSVQTYCGILYVIRFFMKGMWF